MAHEIIKNEDGTFTQVSTIECSINVEQLKADLESYKYQIDALKKMIEETENILKQIEKM